MASPSRISEDLIMKGAAPDSGAAPCVRDAHLLGSPPLRCACLLSMRGARGSDARVCGPTACWRMRGLPMMPATERGAGGVPPDSMCRSPAKVVACERGARSAFGRLSTTVGHGLLLQLFGAVTDADLDLSRLRTFELADADGQDTVGKMGCQVGVIEAVGERE